MRYDIIHHSPYIPTPMTEYRFNNPKIKQKRQKLRNEAPRAEQILWFKLKGKQLHGFKFRRQYSVGPFIVDFYCPDVKLVIEVDGDSHFEESAERYDERREKYIKKSNIKFLRFTNTDVYENMEGVLEGICEMLFSLKKQLTSTYTTP